MSNLPIFYCNRKKGRDKMNFGLRCYSSSGACSRITWYLEGLSATFMAYKKLRQFDTSFVRRTYSDPLLISTGFLKYPLELKKNSVRAEKKNQLVYTDFFFSSYGKFFSVSNLELRKNFS